MDEHHSVSHHKNGTAISKVGSIVEQHNQYIQLLLSCHLAAFQSRTVQKSTQLQVHLFCMTNYKEQG